MAFEISKVFEFSAAHSVHSQKLNPKWALNSYPKCRRLPGHGHNYKLVVYLKSDKLDSTQMVTDFGHLRWFKNFLDECFDHKLILGKDDPAFGIMFEKLGIIVGNKLIVPFGKAKLTGVNGEFRLESFEIKEIVLEELERFVFFTFNGYSSAQNTPISGFYQRLIDGIAVFRASPTSENFAEFFYKFISVNVKPLNVKCSKVEIYETPTSCASYSEDEE